MGLVQIIFLLYSTLQMFIYCHNICVTACSENKNVSEVSFLCFMYCELLLECKWNIIFLYLQVDMGNAFVKCSEGDEGDATGSLV
jgi:hypothetical protein